MANIKRAYTGGAAVSTITATMSASSPTSGGTVAISVSTGWPAGQPFVAVVDRGTPDEEVMLFASRSADLLVLASGGRGFDGTTAKAHLAGAPIEHAWDATSAQALNDHINDLTPTDSHPFLLRRAEHTLAAHDEMGLLPAIEHDGNLHDQLGIMFVNNHTGPNHVGMGLMFTDEHTAQAHQDLGLMSDAEHTRALHTDPQPGGLNLMKAEDFSKAKIDALGVDAATTGGQTATQLHRSLVALVEVPTTSTVYNASVTVADMFLNNVPVVAGHTYGITMHLVLNWTSVAAAARWDGFIRINAVDHARPFIHQPGVTGETYWTLDPTVLWKPSVTAATDDISFRLAEVTNGADLALTAAANMPRSLAVYDYGVMG